MYYISIIINFSRITLSLDMTVVIRDLLLYSLIKSLQLIMEFFAFN